MSNWDDWGDCERVLGLLDRPEPQTMDDLCASTGWSLPRMNDALCKLLLDGKTATLKMRKQGRQKTHYTLKRKDQA